MDDSLSQNSYDSISSDSCETFSLSDLKETVLNKVKK